jgi:hypothetical protein
MVASLIILAGVVTVGSIVAVHHWTQKTLPKCSDVNPFAQACRN